MIVPGLLPLAVDIDALVPLPGNPRRGDVEAIARSLKAFGQRKPIVARLDTGTVIAGNHTLAAARSLGWQQLAVVYVEDDDATAGAYALADNRTAELGDYDQAELLALINDVRETGADLLDAIGFTDNDIAGIIAAVGRIGVVAGTPTDEWAGMPDFDQPSRQAAFQTTIHFPTDEDADNFFRGLGMPRKSSLWWPASDGHVGSNIRQVYVADGA